MEAEVLGSMGPEAYLKDKVKQYQDWYDKKAVRFKAYYLNMRAATVVGGALVPVLVNLDIPFKNHLTTVISLIVVILVSLESVFHHREQWKNYRTTEQFLSSERILFLTKEGPYKLLANREAFLLFVERVEGTIASENAATLNIMTLAAEEKDTRSGSPSK